MVQPTEAPGQDILVENVSIHELGKQYDWLTQQMNMDGNNNPPELEGLLNLLEHMFEKLDSLYE